MIVGVDVSSRRIDLAWLENDKPQRWHQELAKGNLITRLQSIYIAWPGGQVGCTDSPFDTTEIAIEMPFGRSRASIAALMATVGVITHQAPPWARVAWPSAGELRAAIGARNTKQDAHRAVSVIVFDNPFMGPNMILDGWDEHELDALTACIGWTRILQAQDAA